MRIKPISLLMALVFIISATLLPTTAFAAGEGDTTPPALTAVLDGDTVKIESTDDNSGVEAVYIDENRVNSLTDGTASVALKDYAGTGKEVSVYALDYAGNRSEPVKFENPYYEESAAETQAAPSPQTESTGAPQAASTEAASSGTAGTDTTNNHPDNTSGDSNSGSGDSDAENTDQNSETVDADSSAEQEETASSIPEGAFTPDGTGTVLDEANSEDGEKQFYTITTEDGNVFYLVIDGKRDTDNVYFLNGVTEADLMALAQKGDGSVSVIPAGETCTCTDKCEAGKVDTDCPVCKNDLSGCTGKEVQKEEPDEPEPPKKDTGNVGTVVFIIIAVLAVGSIGYYVKIVRPKRQAEEDEDLEDDGYGEGFDPDAAYDEPEYLSEDDFDDRNEDGEEPRP